MTLPSNLSIERLVLGSILLNDACFVELGTLTAADFSLEKHRRIFQRIREMHHRGERIDRVTVANELERFNELEACDGLTYLVSLDDGLPKVPKLERYVEILKEKSLRRSMIFAGQLMMDRAWSESEEPAAILAGVEETLLRLGERRHGAVVLAASDLMTQVVETAAQRKRRWEITNKAVMGIESGIGGLDDILNGFNPGLHLLAGGPGTGKTSLSLQIAREACQRGVPAVYVTYENSPSNLVLKAICGHAGISAAHVERGIAHRCDHQKFQAASRELAPALARLIIMEGSMSLSMAEIRAGVQSVLQQGHDTALVFVDYLQRAAQAQGFSEVRLNVSSLAGHLRDLANRVKCPVLAISSQSRGNYGTGRGNAELSSLKESGDLEYAADSVMFLHPNENRTAVLPALALDLTVSKNRFGPVGAVPLIFRPDIGQFRSETHGTSSRN